MILAPLGALSKKPPTSNEVKWWEHVTSIAEAGRITGIERRNIWKVIKGERLKAGGFRWIPEREVMPYAETVNY